MVTETTADYIQASTGSQTSDHVEVIVDDADAVTDDALHALVIEHLVAVGEPAHGELHRNAPHGMDEIVGHGDAAVPVLVREINRIDPETEWPHWHDVARSRAFGALLAIDTELSGGAAAQIFSDQDADTWLGDYIRPAVIRSTSRDLAGALCRAAEATTDRWRLTSLCSVLALRPERSDRILAVLIGLLQLEPGFAANVLIDYDDDHALPALYAALEEVPENDAEEAFFLSECPDLVEAVDRLGGRLDGPLRDKVRRLQAQARRRSARMRRMLSRRAQVQLAGADIPKKRGPNSPCGCGSGAKTKKCCG